MSNLEKRVYESYAFTKDELEKRNINNLQGTFRKV